MNACAALGMPNTIASQYWGRVHHPLFTIRNGAEVLVEGGDVGNDA